MSLLTQSADLKSLGTEKAIEPLYKKFRGYFRGWHYCYFLFLLSLSFFISFTHLQSPPCSWQPWERDREKHTERRRQRQERRDTERDREKEKERDGERERERQRGGEREREEERGEREREEERGEREREGERGGENGELGERGARGHKIVSKGLRLDSCGRGQLTVLI